MQISSVDLYPTAIDHSDSPLSDVWTGFIFSVDGSFVDGSSVCHAIQSCIHLAQLILEVSIHPIRKETFSPPHSSLFRGTIHRIRR